VPRMASTLVQPWIPTAASSLSMQTPRVKSSPIQWNSAIPTFPSWLRLHKTESFMAFRLSPVPSLVRCRPQASPRSKPLPTFETSLNHGGYLRLPPSSHLEFRCLVVQGCPHAGASKGGIAFTANTDPHGCSPSWSPPSRPSGSTFLAPTPVQAPVQATPR